STKGRKLSIANAGVDGQSTIGHLWNFKYWFPKLSTQPKAYLFYIGINDNWRYDDSASQLRYLRDMIRAKSALYQLYKTISGMYEAQEMGVGHQRRNFREISYTEKGLLSDYSFYDGYLHRDLIPRLDALVREARVLGSDAIFVTQRSYFWKDVNGGKYGVAKPFKVGGKVGGIEVNGIDRYEMEKAQIKAILSFCKDRKLVCIDGDRAVGSEEDFY